MGGTHSCSFAYGGTRQRGRNLGRSCRLRRSFLQRNFQRTGPCSSHGLVATYAPCEYFFHANYHRPSFRFEWTFVESRQRVLVLYNLSSPALWSNRRRDVAEASLQRVIWDRARDVSADRTVVAWIHLARGGFRTPCC